MRRSGCTLGRTCCGTCASISGCASFASACQTPEPGGGEAAAFAPLALAAAEVRQNRGQLLQLLHNTRSTAAVQEYLAEPSFLEQKGSFCAFYSAPIAARRAFCPSLSFSRSIRKKDREVGSGSRRVRMTSISGTLSNYTSQLICDKLKIKYSLFRALVVVGHRRRRHRRQLSPPRAQLQQHPRPQPLRPPHWPRRHLPWP